MEELKASEPLLLDGVLTPGAILKDPTLSAGARLFWVLLAEYQGKVPECYPSQEMLAVPLGVKVRQLQSFIKELESYTRGDPPEPFPLVEVKLVFVEKDRKTRNIYNLLRWPLLAVDLKANGAERSHWADGGDAQYSAHRSEGEAQDAVASGMPPSDTQSSAHQSEGATPDSVAGRRAMATAEGDAQSSAHRSDCGALDTASRRPELHWTEYADELARAKSMKSRQLLQQTEPQDSVFNRNAGRSLGPGDWRGQSLEEPRAPGSNIPPDIRRGRAVASGPLAAPRSKRSGYVEFPKCKYHAAHEAVVVDNAEDEAKLGEGWQDVPL
jgi:hypothetical protein